MTVYALGLALREIEKIDAMADSSPSPDSSKQDSDSEELLPALFWDGSEDWINDHAERLINHPFWVVRAQIARSSVEALGQKARPLLVARLALETEEVVRQQISDLLADLPVN